VLSQRPVERYERSFEVALRRCEQAAATRGSGPVAPAGPLGQRLVLLDVDPRLLRILGAAFGEEQLANSGLMGSL
jgi:hypothetical protein